MIYQTIVLIAGYAPTIVRPSAGASLRMAVDTAFKTDVSDKIMAEAREIMPGGVSSPVRAFKSVGGEPVVFDRVKGSKAYDVDGNEYVDYVGTWGPAIVGHADDTVLAAISETMAKGTSFGAPCALENELAKMVIDAVPSVDMVRFTNSGTEACMGVLRLMRAYTKREKVIKFEGCYNGLASVEALFEANKDEISGVILEGVVGNSGFIVPDQEFLEGLRAMCTKYGALLVFDEVMTGFRISYGGAQAHFGIEPDLSTFGKVIGGGLPVGAYAGKKEIMEHVAPAGSMYQAGTLSGNPLAMRAGIETMKILKQPGTYEQLDEKTEKLINGILDAGREAGHAVSGGHISGMFGFFFTEGPVKCFADAAKSDTEKFARWHRGMLERGVYLAPSQYEAGFMSLAHSDEDIEKTIAAAKEVFAIIR